MFRPRKVQDFSIVKITKKFLNDRESLQRIKHLRYIIDSASDSELKSFFKKYYSLIFNSFYDVFINIQLELCQKVNTSHFKDLQSILSVFEKILILLPELINRKWQFNCIYAIIKTLLHPNNILKIRVQGLQLFILWFQILGTKAPNPCYNILISLIPIFEPIIRNLICADDHKYSSSTQAYSGPIIEIEIKPILTQNLDKELEIDDDDQDPLGYLLRFMITEGIKVEWEGLKEEKQMDSYNFIFDQFKQYFLPVIFPKCKSEYTIVKNMSQSVVTTEFLTDYSRDLQNFSIGADKISLYQEKVIHWIATIVCLDHSHTFMNNTLRMFQSDTLDEDKRDDYKKEDRCKIESSRIEKIRKIIFQNDENINIINQLCQHAFYLPLQFYKTHQAVIYVYQSWLFCDENMQPSFMINGDVSSPIIMRSISNTIESVNEDKPKVKVSLMMQRVLFTNVAAIFFNTFKESAIDPRISTTRQSLQPLNMKNIHSDLVKKVMSLIYRKAINNISNLDYEHLMKVLLDISFNVLRLHKPSNRPANHWINDDDFIGQFFQTLNVLLIKSNLFSCLSNEMWNYFLHVYSSLVDWSSIVVEWKKILLFILRMLGRHLYNVDMDDLPLEKKTRRGTLSTNLKRSNSSILVKKYLTLDEHLINTNSSMEPNQWGSISLSNTFTESLNQNIDETYFHRKDLAHRSIKSDTGIRSHMETNTIIPCSDFSETDYGFTLSDHEENSSYQSADSGSLRGKYKDRESNSGLVSEDERYSSIDPLHDHSTEDLHIDADDEYEVDNNHNVFSSTLTREESDVDLLSYVYRYSDKGKLHNVSKTPKRYLGKGKFHQLKRKERNSISLDDTIANAISVEDFSNQDESSDSCNCHHILMGGTVIGWNQESSVLLWKRCIGLFGSVAKITNPEILLFIVECFHEITNLFIKMRDNMGLPNDNQNTPQPPLYVPPIDYIVPWMFEIFYLDTMPDSIRIIALKTLCIITVRKMDIQPSTEHLVQFYKLIHHIVYNKNMTFICTLIENIGVYLFSVPLCGSEIVIDDMIKACEMILKRSILMPKVCKTEKLPKLEAVSILGSLLKFQDHYCKIKMFECGTKTMNITDSSTYKTSIMELLIFTAKNEPIVPPRVLSIISISQYCYIKVIQTNISAKDLTEIHQNILLLLSLMRFNNLEIATISVNMIRFLSTCFSQIQEKLPHFPEKIIQVLSWTINSSRICYKDSPNKGSKKLICALIFTLVDWCMILPLHQLLDSNNLHPKGLVHLIFSTLEIFLKSDKPAVIPKCSTISNFKLNISESLPYVEQKRQFSIPSTHNSALNIINDLTLDPLNEFQYLFEVAPTEGTDFPSSHNSHSSDQVNDVVQIAARTALCHFINHIGQFPKNNVLGCLTSCVQEHHDFLLSSVKQRPEGGQENATVDDLSPDVFNSPDLQMFVVNGSMIVSLLTLSTKVMYNLDQNSNQTPAAGYPPMIKSSAETTTKESEVRIIIRDLCGKYCWDLNCVYKCDDNINSYKQTGITESESIPPSPPPRRTCPSMLEKGTVQKTITTKTLTNDSVDLLLTDLTSLSPELFSSNQMTADELSLKNFESSLKQIIHDQNNNECNYIDSNHFFKISHPKLVDKKLRTNISIEKSPEIVGPKSKFYHCRQILNHLGFLSLKRRASIDLINKSNIYLDLKCIDNLRSRETHKIAVLYVSWGQEDKKSILRNTESSYEFNTFISGLGWTVDLETHRGFMGGLESNGKSGKYSLYYTNSCLEIMFHVSTWMESKDVSGIPNKFVHLGNDDVMIIWTENYRDFRSNITKTEFADVMIIIYPLISGLFSIQIKTKAELKLFGPLFDGSIVGEKELPVLVRTTAINAGRTIRESKAHFEDHFVTRANYMQKAIKKFVEPMTFEGFVAKLYSPTIDLDEICRGAITSEPPKTPFIRISDVSLASTLPEIVPSNKGHIKFGSPPKINSKLLTERSHTLSERPHALSDDSADHGISRRFSKKY